MESRDRDLILRLVETDMELRRLYSRHQELEELLDDYSNRLFLTPDEEMEAKRLKKEKLSGMDRMMAKLERHRPAGGAFAAV